MTRASAKSSGRRWENWVADYLQPIWSAVERRVQHGRFDRGDLINTGDWMIECKATKDITLGTFMSETVTQQVNADKRWHALVIKRRSHNTDRAYVVMELHQFRAILAELKQMERTS